MFLPGAQLYSFKNEGEVEMEMEVCLPRLSVTLVFFNVGFASSILQSFFSQAALVLNPSPRMMGMNIRMTACEATLESLLQLSLQLYIIFLRSDTMPSLLQVSGLIGTFKCPL